MKIKNKIAIVMTLLSVSMLLIILIFYYNWNHYVLINEEEENIVEISIAVSQEVDTHFSEITNTVITLASAPIISETLSENNKLFDELSDVEREMYISELGAKWQTIDDVEDPFLQVYLNNPVADYLKLQKELIEGRYGELFITNRYGVIIATTNKLTTVNHAHKYWWTAGFADGIGRIFLDDRGFDASAEGYVIGVVIPIKDDGQVIGMIKANVNIFDILNHVIESYEEIYSGSNVKITRSGGVIVAEKDTVPLSTTVCETTLKHLDGTSSTFEVTEEDTDYLSGVSEISITRGNDTIGFGGSYESIDHIKGNTGESWHSVICIEQQLILDKAEDTTHLLLVIGIIFTLTSSLFALYMGKKISDPIVKLAHFSEVVGQGKLDEKINVKSNDEIGFLANSYNNMVDNLKTTMASKDELILEIEKRKATEEIMRELSVTDELTGLYNRRASNEFLQTAIEKVDRYNEKLSAILLDIDHFKIVNDTYGHDVGDRVLVSLAKLLKESVRNVDMVARVGGEEFLILLPQINKDQASGLAERIRMSIEAYSFDEIDKLTVSMGVSEQTYQDTFDSLLKRVDDGLYESKNSGRNKVTSL